MRVNELYFLIEYKILSFKRKAKVKNRGENFFSRGICLLTSWACTIGKWSTLTQLNLIRQVTSFVIIRNDNWNMHIILYIYPLFQLLLGNLCLAEWATFSYMLSRSYQSGSKVGMRLPAMLWHFDHDAYRMTYTLKVPAIRINLSQENIKLVRVNWEFALTKFKLADGKLLWKSGQIQGISDLVHVSKEFELTEFE